MELTELFLDHLKDIYYAERQVTKALPKIAKAAENAELRDMFKEAKDEKAHHVELLQSVFETVGKRATGKTCEAMDGLIAEMTELLEEAKEPSAVRDAGLIANAQAIAHYGMARYGAMLAWAKVEEDLEDAVEPLEELLEAHKEADEHLSHLANTVLNLEAADEEDDEEHDGDEEEEEEEEPVPAPAPARAARGGKRK